MKACNVIKYPNPTEIKEYFKYEESTGRLIWKKGQQKDKYAGWFHKNSGYIEMYFKGKTYKQHRIIYIMHKGAIPYGYEVDHIDNIRNNNKIENLQILLPIDNTKKKKKYKRNKSGINGVGYHKRDKIWFANIRVSEKLIHLGNFKTKEEALTARLEANKKYGFAETHGQKIPETKVF